MVTFLWRYGSKPEATKAGSFVGVGSNAYYKDAVAWAAENGITSGVDDISAHKPRPDKSRAGFVRPPEDAFF